MPSDPKDFPIGSLVRYKYDNITVTGPDIWGGAIGMVLRRAPRGAIGDAIKPAYWRIYWISGEHDQFEDIGSTDDENHENWLESAEVPG